jgi:hypothetical protein
MGSRIVEFMEFVSPPKSFFEFSNLAPDLILVPPPVLELALWDFSTHPRSHGDALPLLPADSVIAVYARA